MVSKGQKFNNYTKEFKEKVILEKTIKEDSYTSLSRKYNIPDGTIRTWIRQFNTNGGEIIEKPRGRQKDEAID